MPAPEPGVEMLSLSQCLTPDWFDLLPFTFHLDTPLGLFDNLPVMQHLWVVFVCVCMVCMCMHVCVYLRAFSVKVFPLFLHVSLSA